ncbi:unnamed protein product, partial [Schistosoma mattheei]
CITSLCYLLVGDIYSLITYLGFVQWLAIGSCVFIVIVFRITRRHHPRPVKLKHLESNFIQDTNTMNFEKYQQKGVL